MVIGIPCRGVLSVALAPKGPEPSLMFGGGGGGY